MVHSDEMRPSFIPKLKGIEVNELYVRDAKNLIVSRKNEKCIRMLLSIKTNKPYKGVIAAWDHEYNTHIYLVKSMAL